MDEETRNELDSLRNDLNTLDSRVDTLEGPTVGGIENVITRITNIEGHAADTEALESARQAIENATTIAKLRTAMLDALNALGTGDSNA